jgi:hypothetical protein
VLIRISGNQEERDFVSQKQPVTLPIGQKMEKMQTLGE